MTKQEFLNELRMALSGKMGSLQIDNHARYYEEYINAEIRKGKTEEEVLAMLGNPRLIARSILDAEGINDGATRAKNENAYGGGYRSGYYDGNASYEDSQVHGYVQRKKINLPSWLIILLVVLTIVAVIGIVVAVVWWLAPIILVIWLIVFLIKNIKPRE